MIEKDIGMKVLFISTGDAKYGAPKSMLALMELLRERHKVEVVLLTTKHNELNEYCAAHGIENYSCYYSDMMAGSSYESKAKNLLKHIVKYELYVKGCLSHNKVNKLGIDFTRIDLIHSNTNRVDIGAYISEKYNIPHIWHLREMDEGTKGMVYYKRNWTSYMNNHATEYIAITRAVKDSWAKHGLAEDKIRVIYNGIDAAKIEERQIRNDGKIKIAAVGRIEKSKGQEDLIRAVTMLPVELQEKIQIDFMGGAYPEYERKLKRIQEKKKCMAQINYLGYCKNVVQQLKNYDIGITCSTAEAFGRTTVEYMMAGLLVVASDTGANPELIEDGKSGLLYRQGDAEQLSEVLQKICENNIDVEKLRKQGKERAEELFTAEKNADRIYEEYMSLLK